MGTLRVLLAISVVYSHLGYASVMLVGGAIAVQAFFLISGFLISFVLMEVPAYGNPAAFWLNRALRLFPIYYVVLVITVVWLVSFDRGFVAEFFDLRADLVAFMVAVNLTIIGQDIPNFVSLAGAIPMPYIANSKQLTEYLLVPPAWFLSLELMFYMLAPFFVRRWPVLLLVLLASFFLRVIGISLGYGLSNPWSNKFFPFELFWFSLGALIQQIGGQLAATLDERWPLFKWACYAAVVTVTIGYPLVRLVGGAHFTAFRSVCYLFFVASCLPFLFLVQNSARWDKWIGEFSYPVYICHFLCIAIAAHFLGAAPGIKSIPVATVALALTAVMSVFLLRMNAYLVDDLRSRVRRGSAEKIPSTAGAVED